MPCDSGVQLVVQREVAGDSGVKICKVLHYLKGVIADGDAGSAADILAHDVCFLQADGQPKLIRGTSEAAD